MLEAKGVEFDRRDYFKDPFSVDELQALFDEAGLSPGDVLSKRSRAYKELGLAERALTDRELIALMVEHPTLLRRPLVIGDSGEVVVGFSQGELERLVHGDG